MSGDPFAGVLGAGRGRPEPEIDTVLSLAPTQRAKDALARLARTLEGRRGDPTEAFAALQAMRGAPEPRPFERRVREMLARHLAVRAVAQTDHQLARLLSDTRIYDAHVSEHLVSVRTGSRSIDSYVHLWAEGHLYALFLTHISAQLYQLT